MKIKGKKVTISIFNYFKETPKEIESVGLFFKWVLAFLAGFTLFQNHLPELSASILYLAGGIGEFIKLFGFSEEINS